MIEPTGDYAALQLLETLSNPALAELEQIIRHALQQGSCQHEHELHNMANAIRAYHQHVIEECRSASRGVQQVIDSLLL